MEPPKRLCGLPGPRRAGSKVLLGLAPGGVCLAAASPRRRCALTAPFHLCLYATQLRPRHRLCISVALSRGFPRVGVTHRPALWCPDFPRGVFSPPAVRSARLAMVARRPSQGKDLDLAEDADHLAEDARLSGEDRLHFLVFRLQPDVVLLAVD